VRVDDGRLHTELGAAEDPDLELAMDMETFFAVASGQVVGPRATGLTPRAPLQTA
jgi:hypothetical protein